MNLRPDQKLVAMSDELFQVLVAKEPDQRVEVHWGEPDAEGVYTPTIYRLRRPSLWARFWDWFTRPV